MPLRRLWLTIWAVLLVLLPGSALAQKEKIAELGRDVALLQDQVRTLQRGFDERMGAVTVLMQQTLDAANKANTAIAVLEASFRDRMKEQEKNVVGPVAGVGAKVDQMSTDFQALRESVADMTSRVGKLQTQILDLNNTIKTIQAPPPPPGGAGGTPPMPAAQLYENAVRDKNGGKYDLALQQFNDYLKYYPDTDMSPNSQFHLGDIYFAQGDLDSAFQAFDLVLEKYPDNNKTPDALFMKGQTLAKMGKRNQAATVYRELITRFPRHELAARARAALKTWGVPAAQPKTR